MAKPIIVVKENGFEIEVDLRDEPCRRFEIVPPCDPSQTYVLRWDIELDEGGGWEVEQRVVKDKKQIEVRWDDGERAGQA